MVSTDYTDLSYLCNLWIVLPACNADFSLHKAFDGDVGAIGFRFANKLGVDFEDAGFDEFFQAEIVETACLHLAHKLRVDLEDCGFEEIIGVEFTETRGSEIVGKCGGHVYSSCRKQTILGFIDYEIETATLHG